MRQTLKAAWGVVVGAVWLGTSALAVQPPSRIAGDINSNDRVELAGSVTRRPATATALGALPGDTQLTRMTLVIAPSSAQQAELDQLLAEQQNPASANFHKWLTPVQFGERFGASDADLAKIRSWLSSQGLEVLSVAPSRNGVFFSGTSATVEAALGVSMQRFRKNGQEFFENSDNVRIPKALNGIVSGVTNLSSYRLKSNLVRRSIAASARPASPDYTDTTGNHELVPWDFRQIYGLNTLVNAGFTGAINIAIVGQSAVNTTQIGYFQALTGQTAKAPTLTLVPNTGVSTLISGDEGESEIDIEYAGGTASGSSIQFVYTGNGKSNGVFDSVIYAVTQDVAPILSMSYGGCEREESTYATGTFEPYLRQANAQGQTILVSAGDYDAATCDVIDATSGGVTIASEGLTTSYPASSPYVTAVGGTSFNESSGAFWNGTNNNFGGSAIGYIPETTWNETAVDGTASTGYFILGTGGGASAIFGKPSWQAGVGVPGDGKRDIPDVAFNAAVYTDPYAFCSAEVNSSNVATELCTTTTFPLLSNGLVVGVGGTSLSAPNFAAMLAIVEQKNGVTTGLGNINASLYALAGGTSATSIFNDVTTGNNIVPCVIGTPDCTTGMMGFTAAAGYDQTTGLGSINGAALATGLAGLTTAGGPKVPTVTVTVSPTSPAINTAITATVAVASTSSTTVPTGTVQFTVDGTAAGSSAVSATGYATYTISGGFATVGTHSVAAAYSGDANYSAASSTLTLTVGAPASTSGTFALSSSPATLTVTSGSSGAETITVTPASGYLGVVNFSASASGTGTLSACYTLPNAIVSSQAPTGSATMTIYTSASACAVSGRVRMNTTKRTLASGSRPAQPGLPGKPVVVLLSGALLGCFALRRRARWPLMVVLGLCVALFPGVGCGGGGSTAPVTGPTTPTSPTTGTSFTITVTGASSTNATLTASTSYTLTIN